MALWKEQTPGMTTSNPTSTAPREPERPAAVPLNAEHARRAKEQRTEMKESVLAADLTIEGKIEGAGHVRIGGRFKGDVNVDGNVTIESGAHLTGHVRARMVTVGGELNGNIEGAQRVELLETGILNGDVKAGALTVAAGSRMRGQVEFGWEEKGAKALSVG